MSAGAHVDDLEQLLDGALADFDCESAEHAGPAHDTAPTARSDASAACQQAAPSASVGKFSASGSEKKGAKFNPLGRKPRKPKQPTLPPPTIKDVNDVSQEELEASAKEITSMLQSMMKENQPADASNSSNQAPHDSAASIMSTLDQVNQAARKAAEGSTGTWSSPSAAGPQAGEAVAVSEAEELQKLLEAMQGAMGGGGEGGMNDSFVDTLMHGILCKDVLYEPLKDVRQRYPKWLEENKGKIPPEEHAQHSSQLAHINAICTLLEEHGDTKFDELLRLLQELQAMGQPPQELLAEMQAANGSSGDQAGDLGALGQQCPMQ